MPTGPAPGGQAEARGPVPPGYGAPPAAPGAPGTPAAAPGAPPAAPGAPGGGNAPWKATPGLDPEGKNAINNGEYQIQSGDTLNTILERAYGKDNVAGKMQDVVKANSGDSTASGYANIKNPDLIYAGDKIKLPGADTTDSLTGKPTTPAAPGDVQPQAGVPKNEPGGTGDAAANRAAESPGSNVPIGAPGAPTPPPALPKAPGAPNAPATNQVAPVEQPAPVRTTNSSRHGSWRYAETSDAALLDKLREMSSTPASEDMGHMDTRNDEVRDVVDELNDRGYDASFMVAAVEDPTSADPSFLGLSSPDWADMGAQGSGPSPKEWISDSAGYVEEQELPHHERDWFDEPDGDIIKFNDSRSKPQQGPKSAAAILAALHYGGAGEDEQAKGEGYFNPDNPDAQDWEQASGDPFLDELSQHLPGGGGGGLPGKGGGGAAGEAGGEAQRAARRLPG